MTSTSPLSGEPVGDARPRPHLHLTPDHGWLNDPHGVFYLDGRYHLFFQHVPDSLEWSQDIRWGHATSIDLLHWRSEPDAILPGDGDEGCWSGCAVIDDDGGPVLFYTSVAAPDWEHGRVRSARLDPVSGDWVKGPVVAASMDPASRLFRDPMIFADGDRWRMVVGSGTVDETAGAQTFTSADLHTWEYDGWFAQRHTVAQSPWTGSGWECPQVLVDVAGAGGDVLVVSIWDGSGPCDVAAATGSVVDGRFVATTWRTLAVGLGHFAATAFTDAEGRDCLIFWIREISDPGRWTGALSVPYVVSSDAGGVRLAPHPNIAAARRPADGAPGAAIDVEWRPSPGSVLTLAGADGRPRAVIEASTLGLRVTAGRDALSVDVAHEGPTLRVIADAQVLEVVADGGLVGLALDDPEGGFVASADVPDSLRWWHL